MIEGLVLPVLGLASDLLRAQTQGHGIRPGGALECQDGRVTEACSRLSHANALPPQSALAEMTDRFLGSRVIALGYADLARTDDEILRDVVDAVLGDVRLNLEGLSVQVTNGAVTLQGKVPDLYQRSLAEEVVSRIKGVSHVTNHLQLGEVPTIGDEEIADQVRASLSRDALVPQGQVSVSVQNQIVHLTGVVEHYVARSNAEDDARLVRGVRDVVNEIVVAPGPRRSDSQISGEVRMALLSQLCLGASEIEVAVHDGMVRLKGSVVTVDLRRRAEEVALRTPGVLGVQNDIVVVT